MIKKYSLVLAAFLCFVLSGFGQYTVDFEDDTKTAYASGTVTLNGIIWDMTEALIGDLTADYKNGLQSARLRGYASSAITMLENKANGLGTISFNYRRYGSDTQVDWRVEYSTNNGSSWIQIGSSFTAPNSDTIQVFNETVNVSGDIRVRIIRETTSGSSNRRLNIDDIIITDYTGVSTPNISVSQSTILGLDYIIGNGPSSAQSYQISGTNLTPASGAITVTAPTNFSISKTLGGTYTSSLTYNYTGGTLNASNVYVRLNGGLSVGTYGPLNITHSGGGATTVNTSVSGDVTASSNSDIIAVSGSESATISSLVNNPAPLSVTQGVQVWQFRVRDGGALLNDADNLPTILTGFTLAQNPGNQIGTWSDAIETIALFDGSTRIANGTVTANQIQFTGLNVSVADGTQRTLSLRLSIKCPLGPDAHENEDFVFSLSEDNTTFSNTGSGKTNFSAQTSTNNQNSIDVVATQLAFTTQPVSTGVNSPMSDVVVSAVDTCGNLDVDFSGPINLTSTGTLTGAPLTVNAISGEGTFSNMVHTSVGTNFTMNGTTTGLTIGTSAPFDITNTTTLNKGDLAILAVNTNTGSGGTDQIAFVSFLDILPGTQIYLTDNGYEREYAGEWGGTEGVISITRTGSTLPKGTIIVIESTNGNITNPSHFDVFTCGSLDTNWTKTAIGGGSIGGFNLNSDDDIWIMQGGLWTNDINHHSTYTGGNVLYGWTESGWNNAPGGTTQSTKWSTIYPGLECFNTIAPVGDGYVKFNDPINPDFSTTTNGRLDWIALINDTGNWDTYSDNSSYNSGGYDYLGNTSCPAMTIAATGYINGKWVGRADTNWFNCLNWDTLVVPDETVDVLVDDNILNNHANVDTTAPFASYYGGIAKTKNLTITGEKVEISSSLSNKLEVHGNLLIDLAGALDMDDGNFGTLDGELYLYGNWTNNLGTSAFDEGNGTVIFSGTTPQTVNVSIPLPPPTNPTEEYYNVILNNDFSTSVSNDLYMNGNLTVNPGVTLEVAADDYVHINNNLTNNGTFNILNNGSLIQVDDTGINIGNINMERMASVDNLDYVYWSSPVNNFNVNNISSTSYIYKWNPTFSNTNGTLGNWVSATGENMQKGVGYIVRGSNGQAAPINPGDLNFTVNFNQVPFNGLTQVNVSRGNLAGVDDQWNLIGNPYPSAVDVFAFLTHGPNNVLDGFVNFWTHGTDPSPIEVDPFYYDFGSNYTASDYIPYNATGAGNGPGNLSIAAGQSFMVNLLDTAPTNTVIEFNNSMRNRSYDNSQFYRTTEPNFTTAEKHRIWLDLVSDNQETNRILVGYIEGATMERDRLYDAISSIASEQQLYSLISGSPFIIQGRALPFQDTDVIPLGINITSQGNYYIGIAYIDGLFETNNQTIYLKDNLLNIIHNLNNAPYTFTSGVGEFNERFELVFRDSFLSVNEEELTSNHVSIIEHDNGEVTFKVPSQYKIQTVDIIDLLGRTVYNLKGNSSTETYNLSNLSQATYVARVTLANGQVLTKKAVKRK